MDLLPAVHLAAPRFAQAVTESTNTLCQDITKAQGVTFWLWIFVTGTFRNGKIASPVVEFWPQGVQDGK